MLELLNILWHVAYLNMTKMKNMETEVQVYWIKEIMEHTTKPQSTNEFYPLALASLYPSAIFNDYLTKRLFLVTKISVILIDRRYQFQKRYKSQRQLVLRDYVSLYFKLPYAYIFQSNLSLDTILAIQRWKKKQTIRV